MQIHQKLIDHYSGLSTQVDSATQTIDRDAQSKYKVELLYHQLSISPAATLGKILTEFFVDFFEDNRAIYRYVQIVSEAGQELDNFSLVEVSNWLNDLVVSATDNNHQRVIDAVRQLVAYGGIAEHGLAKAYEILALQYVELKQNADAVTAYSQSIEYSPAPHALYHDRGHIYQLVGDYGSALADFNKSLDLVPDKGLYYRCRANTLMLLDRDEEAINDLSKAIELDPHLANTYHGRAHYYERRAEYKAALADYSKAIELEPDRADHYGCRGKLLSGNPQELSAALADLSKAVELSPGHEYTHHLRAHVYQGMNNDTAAIADYTEAIKLAPENPKNYQCRGTLYAHMGSPDKALSDFSKIIELHPDSPYGYLHRGEIYLNLQDYSLASKDFEIAVDTTSGNSEVIYMIAAKYASFGNIAETCRWLQKALEIEPQLVDLINHDSTFDAIRQADAFSQLMNKFTSGGE